MKASVLGGWYTVDYAAQVHVHKHAAMKKSRGRSGKPRSGDLQVITVDRRVWAAALAAADGDPKRIRIVSATRVEITG